MPDIIKVENIDALSYIIIPHNVELETLFNG